MSEYTHTPRESCCDCELCPKCAALIKAAREKELLVTNPKLTCHEWMVSLSLEETKLVLLALENWHYLEILKPIVRGEEVPQSTPALILRDRIHAIASRWSEELTPRHQKG